MLEIVEDIELTVDSSDADWEKYCVVMRAMNDHYARMTIGEMRDFVDRAPQLGAQSFYAQFSNNGKAAVSFHKLSGQKYGNSHRIHHAGAIEFNDPQEVVDEVWGWIIDKLRSVKAKGFVVIAPGTYNLHIFQQAVDIIFGDNDAKVDFVRGGKDKDITKEKIQHNPGRLYKWRGDFKPGKGGGKPNA